MFPSASGNPLLDHIDQKMSELHPLARRAIFQGLPGAAEFGAGVGGPVMPGGTPAGDAQPAVRPIPGPMPQARSLTPTESPEQSSFGSIMDPGSNRQRLAEMRAAPQPPVRSLGPAPAETQ